VLIKSLEKLLQIATELCNNLEHLHLTDLHLVWRRKLRDVENEYTSEADCQSSFHSLCIHHRYQYKMYK